ncbi:unnamed protein product [Didymodactylos carnosus]|uniref:Uncharacterized protein n=1 Tax=Didymodactylos carnosus TaxID=1234261 RepID=A0A8S2EN60_9BILA|nr:unnamed protein product [Didymodactylos carnosus]CAF4002834.1 unnamed protein product [Didymodactylos carnosus]
MLSKQLIMSGQSKSNEDLKLRSNSAEFLHSFKNAFIAQTNISDYLAHVIKIKRLAKMPLQFLAKRRKIRRIAMDVESSDESYADEDAKSEAASQISDIENEAKTFEEYTQQLENALNILSTMKREEYESRTALKQLKFLENLIHQPKEWISGAKLKLAEKKFPELAMTLMGIYKEKGLMVRRIVFVHSILLYNCVANFTDGEFDKEGLIRKQAADVGFIEFAVEILNNPSYSESLKKSYVIENPAKVIGSDDFKNYQKILWIVDSSLTILYNMANIPELKIHFRECNAVTTIAEYTKLKSETVCTQFEETPETKEYMLRLNELQDIINAIRVTSCLVLPLIMNEDEDNLLAQANEVLPLLIGLIHMYKKADQRFYGFSFVELVEGLSKIMVKGRMHTCIDKSLVNLLLDIMNTNDDVKLLECVSSAILNASFDEKALHYNVWMDIDNINGGVLESMAAAKQVDFATIPFEEAFAVLIREIETLRHDLTPGTGPNVLDYDHAKVFKNAYVASLQTTNTRVAETENAVLKWDGTAVRQWMIQTGLRNTERALAGVNGRLLWRLFQMKCSAPESYYRIVDKYFDRVWFTQMNDILKFDDALEQLFR